MSNPCLILEVSKATEWLAFKGCRRIAPDTMPTVLHPSREVAEAEALRLTLAHPGRQFAVFEAVSAGHTYKVATHITLGGQVVQEQLVAKVVQIGEDEIPF